MEDKQPAHRQPQVTRRTNRKRRKPHPKEKSPSLKDNLPTGGRAGRGNLEADRRSGYHNGKNQEFPKTSSHREVHPEIGHQLQQGAKLNHRLRVTSGPDPKGETKPSYRSRTNKPRHRRGGPIAKVWNTRREEKVLEPVYPEPDGGRRAGRKHKKLQAQ